jgi:deoxyribonuclease V
VIGKYGTRPEGPRTLLIHPWIVSPKKAIEIQEGLRKKLRLRPPKAPFKTVAAADVSYSLADDRFYAAFLVFSYPGLDLMETASARGRVSFPYIPGLLTFREAPILLKAFSRLKSKPGLLLFDGQGIAHPRSMGIAAHMGILLDLPSIGCAKSRLWGEAAEPGPDQGSCVLLCQESRTVGMIVRTRTGVKPVYVSPGHRMDLDASVKIILSLCRGYRIPEPLRQAHIFVNQLREKNDSLQNNQRKQR